MMKTVNLNDYVFFELTDEGYEILDQYIRSVATLIKQDVSRNHFVRVDEKGFEYMTTWEFMKIFGEHMRNGQRAVVKSNNVFFK